MKLVHDFTVQCESSGELTWDSEITLKKPFQPNCRTYIIRRVIVFSFSEKKRDKKQRMNYQIWGRRMIAT